MPSNSHKDAARLLETATLNREDEKTIDRIEAHRSRVPHHPVDAESREVPRRVVGLLRDAEVAGCGGSKRDGDPIVKSGIAHGF